MCRWGASVRCSCTPPGSCCPPGAAVLTALGKKAWTPNRCTRGSGRPLCSCPKLAWQGQWASQHAQGRLPSESRSPKASWDPSMRCLFPLPRLAALWPLPLVSKRMWLTGHHLGFPVRGKYLVTGEAALVPGLSPPTSLFFGYENKTINILYNNCQAYAINGFVTCFFPPSAKYFFLGRFSFTIFKAVD